MWIPAGFAHGFLVLTESADFLYKASNYYEPNSERSIRWNDATIGIEWPELGFPALLSPKDGAAPSLNDAQVFV